MTFQEMISRAPDEHWIDAVQTYLYAGGDIHRTLEGTGWSLLHLAAEYENAEVISHLAENGADLNVQDPNGWTPLHLAVDADIDSANQTRREAQMIATTALIQAGADPKMRNKNGDTPRDIASHYDEKALALYDSIIQETTCKYDE